jgi:hypothetical protein
MQKNRNVSMNYVTEWNTQTIDAVGISVFRRGEDCVKRWNLISAHMIGKLCVAGPRFKGGQVWGEKTQWREEMLLLFFHERWHGHIWWERTTIS